jgi:hypothetical protein
MDSVYFLSEEISKPDLTVGLPGLFPITLEAMDCNDAEVNASVCGTPQTNEDMIETH